MRVKCDRCDMVMEHQKNLEEKLRVAVEALGKLEAGYAEMNDDFVVYRNELFYVKHLPNLSSFFIYTKNGDAVEHYSYDILTFPIMSYAKVAMKKAIKRADKFLEISKAKEKQNGIR